MSHSCLFYTFSLGPPTVLMIRIAQKCPDKVSNWIICVPWKRLLIQPSYYPHERLFSSPKLKAHGWANSVPVTPASVRRPLSVRPPTSSNIFSSETTGPIKFKFHMETYQVVGMKVCSNGPGHMTKMAATPIYGKNPLKIFFSRTRKPMTLGLGM